MGEGLDRRTDESIGVEQGKKIAPPLRLLYWDRSRRDANDHFGYDARCVMTL